jgi:hypothetical protein
MFPRHDERCDFRLTHSMNTLKIHEALIAKPTKAFMIACLSCSFR